ncbi:hypothetical protein SAMN05421640_3611 [Ekhidna lutea]|uniref:DUF2116 family Zn-ribbon domain-containing protein n=1 Tax=Ekhidna lutea TaxID=447679 RepID=A0A239M4L6_EKHLU|nr:AraC family transcriptional regulator [Ekhidna lutea]SNT37098.1 hypothetical protein SAMN05421640_3611 [Ekhidna lutea]
MENLSPKQCLQCGNPLVGRADKKFCDAYCRNSYNNQHKAAEEQYIMMVNSQIRRNRRILKDLCPEGKSTVRKEVLDRLGYDYRYFSSIFKSQFGPYYLVYDYGFSPMTDDRGIKKAIIIQRQDYMDEPSFNIWKKS